MTMHATVDQDLTHLVAEHLGAALKDGAITLKECAAAVAAIRHGDVSLRRDDDGTIEVALGAAAIIQVHLLDLPSAAAEWEARLI